MRLCFSTLGCTEYSLTEVLDLCRRFSISDVEIRGLGGVLDNAKIPEFAPEALEGTAKALAAAGVHVPVLGTSCSFHDPQKREQALREGILSAQIASALGCPYLRVFGNRALPDLHSAQKNLTEGLRSLCETVAPTGVQVLLEVHGDFNTREALLPVTEALSGLDGFGLLWDVCHTDRPYGDAYGAFLDEFFPLIRHVHIKDRRRADGGLCLCGQGDLPLRRMARDLSARGYNGCLSLEWERRWHPELEPQETALEAFLSVFGTEA